ncbi:MAG: hypothetical protein GY938_30830 [Ketobacter sp.]|nr:hypothetical protein [Ketobacter sp.]
MGEVSERKQYRIAGCSITTLAVLCAADEDKIVDLLTGYLWDEEEAGQIKEAIEG